MSKRNHIVAIGDPETAEVKEAACEEREDLASKVKEREGAYKDYYIEVEAFRSLGWATSYVPHRYVVKATSPADAIILAFKKLGFAISDENVRHVTFLSKEQYEFLELSDKVNEMESDARGLMEKLDGTRHLCYAGILAASISLFLWINVIVRMAFS